LCFENQKYSSALGKHPAATPALRVVVIAVIHNLFYVQLNDFSPCCREDYFRQSNISCQIPMMMTWPEQNLNLPYCSDPEQAEKMIAYIHALKILYLAMPSFMISSHF
jgi:hypothetical protein